MHNRKSRRVSPLGVLFVLLMIVVFIVGMAHIMSSNGEQGHSQIGNVQSIQDVALAIPLFSNNDRAGDERIGNDRIEDVPNHISSAVVPFTRGVHITEITDTQYLKLVNRDLPITNHVCDTRLTTVWPDMDVGTVYVQLHVTAFYAMRELFTLAQNSGINSLFIASGFRTHDEQNRLYTTVENLDYVMPPGHSEHQLGLAADILSTNGSMRGSMEAEWLRNNAPAFGLILRYPDEKQHITGVPYEPWHFRYVGRVHARYMGVHDFVLEEYIEFLQANSLIQTEFNGRTYYILYQVPHNGIIFVPEHMSFQVSSTNTGGYVVTAWEG